MYKRNDNDNDNAAATTQPLSFSMEGSSSSRFGGPDKNLVLPGSFVKSSPLRTASMIFLAAARRGRKRCSIADSVTPGPKQAAMATGTSQIRGTVWLKRTGTSVRRPTFVIQLHVGMSRENRDKQATLRLGRLEVGRHRNLCLIRLKGKSRG